jgi:large repetitive protein
MSINVVVSSTAAGVSVSGGTAVAITVDSVNASVPVTVGGGIGPAGFIINPGTASSAFGTFQLAAGDGITISTSAAQFQIASYGTAAVASLAPVQSVAGRVGSVQLQASDVTAGTFAIARIPTISYTALANVPAEFTPAAHTHDAVAISSGTLSIARIPTISYTALSNTPATFAPSAHTHSTADVVAFTAAASAAAPVQSVQSRTGAIVLTRADITAAAEVHTHSTTDIVSFTAAASAAAPVQSVAGRTGAISLAAADVAGLASVATSGSYTSLQDVPATFAPASHTHDAAAITSGVLELARIPTIGYTALSGVPATFAPQAHTHSTADVVGLTATFSQVGHAHQYVQVLNGLTGTVSIAGGAGVTVSTASSSITISAAGGGGSANIVEAATAAAFPAVGSVGTIYHATDVRRLYFWDATGNVYAEAGPSSGGGGGGGGGITSVVEAATYAALPSPGVANTIYVVRSTSQIYRFDTATSAYFELSSNESIDSLLRSLFRPGPPTAVSAVAGNAQATVSWTAPTGVIAQAPITNYTVEHTLAGGSPQTFSTGSTATSYMATSLQNGGSYVFRVRAENILGAGVFSAASAAVTPTAGGNDPSFASVSLLLHMEGATLVDSSANGLAVTAYEGTEGTAPTNPFLVTTEKKFGDKSFSGNGAAYGVTAVTQTSPALGFGTGDFCIEGWSYTSNASSDLQYLFYLPSGVFVAIQRVDGYPQLRINNGSWQYSDAFEVPHGQWNYIAVSRTSGQLSAYVNGTRVFTAADSRNYGASDKFYTAINLNGFVDEIRVTKGSDRGYTGSTITVPTAAFPNNS